MYKHFFTLFTPLIISNVLHMVVVKKDLFSQLKTPISKKLFGKNKTIRGFLVVSVLNGFFYFVLNNRGIESLLIGGVLGMTYMLFELPNSFIKRKMGIAEGEPSRMKVISFVVDKSDSALGVSLVYCILFQLDVLIFCKLFLAAFFIHSFFSYLLLKLSLKEKI